MRTGVVMEEQGRQNIFAVEPQVYVDAQVRTGFYDKAGKSMLSSSEWSAGNDGMRLLRLGVACQN